MEAMVAAASVQDPEGRAAAAVMEEAMVVAAMAEEMEEVAMAEAMAAAAKEANAEAMAGRRCRGWPRSSLGGSAPGN